MTDPRRWSAVVVYAIAMALLEAAVVAYLRTLIGRIDPFHPVPLPVPAWLMRIELAREAATLVMLGGGGLARGTRAANAPGLLPARVRRVGHLLLRLPRADDRLAALATRLGRAVPDPAAVVGAGAGAGVDRGSDDRRRHAGEPVHPRRPRAVAARLAARGGNGRRRARAVSRSWPTRCARRAGARRRSAASCRRASTGRFSRSRSR